METYDKAKLKKEIMQKIGLNTRDEAVAKSINDLTDEEKLEYFTNLAPGEDNQFALMACIADRYDIAWLKKFVVKAEKLRTSVNGWRANQVVTVAVEKMKEERKSILGRILHRDKNDRWKVEEFE